MRERPITMAITEPHFALRAVPDHYELAPRGRLAWLQRLLWRALHKMGALKSGLENAVSYKTVTIDAERVIDRAREAHIRLNGVGARPTRLLLGPPDMAELMRDATFEELGRQIHAERFQFRDLTIEVVPHMRGVLVL
jgi:hypothetical protein